MDRKEFATKTVIALQGHVQELSSIEDAIMNGTAANGRKDVLKDIFKELSDTAAECHKTTEFYDEQDPMPAEVRKAIADALQAMNTTLSALVLRAS